MADQMTTAFARQFADNFKLVSQQLETDLRSKVTVETNIKDKKYIDYVGVAGEPQQQIALVQDLVLDQLPHTRRLVFAYPWSLGVPIPKAATLRMLADPTNPYQQAIKAAFERFLEKRLFLAAIGSSIAAATEELTETSIALPSTQKTTESGTLGMTAAKILGALTRFNLNKRKKSKKFLALAPLSIENLLMDVDVTYVQQVALEQIRTGEIHSLWGFNVMMSTELPKTAYIRSNVAWCQEGLAIGFNEDFNAEIQPRYEKINLKQIAATMDFGCTRLQETDVFEIQAYEAY